VRFTEWTEDGGLRHPMLLGMRTDKKPEEVHREGERDGEAETEPVATAEAAEVGDRAPSKRAGTRTAGAAPSDPSPREVRLSNLKKVFWPDEGYTKGDLIAYYDTVAPLMLPYLRDRPAVLTRYP